MNILSIKDLKGDKPHFFGYGNIKLGAQVGVWSTMKGGKDEVRYISKYNGTCYGTCGSHCKECTGKCYVNKSYNIYPSVVQSHAVNTVWLRENIKQTFEILHQQLTNKRNKFQIIRINQSGEITGVKELIQWCKLAKLHPETQFYLYTKNYKAIDSLHNSQYLETNKMPQNMTILISVWHKQGVNAYQKYKDKDYIKAFVYDDGEVHLKPQTYCKAYDDAGHMNHDITCDKCKKCFNRNDNCKIIGCVSH